MPASADWSVVVGADRVSAMYEPAEGQQSGVMICAHGAGGNMRDRSTAAAAKALRAAGLGVVRFNFLYKERGSGRPDPMPTLMECASAVARYAAEELEPPRLIIGGRSMGGRAFSMLAAEGFRADGLLLLAYPLHPPGQHEKLRDAHLPSIAMPTLCFNGTRDEFCDPALMKQVLQRAAPTWTMHWIDGADHSFHVLKSSGRNDAQVQQEVTSATRQWLAALA